MSHEDTASQLDSAWEPISAQRMADDLAACGLAAGQTVLVHTSMRRIGWVIGGAQALLLAMLRVLGTTGTLMMPAHTGNNSEPSYWQHPPIPESWWPLVRQHTPAYHPALTPTRAMGRAAELFRTWPGVRRSAHPLVSFAALGPNADFLTENHALESALGEDSPLARLYDLDGWVMLLGVDHGNNTSLHLAEHRADWPGKRYYRQGSAMMVDGERRWVEYDMLDPDDEDFARLGDDFETERGLERGTVGAAVVRFMRQRAVVDYAVGWMERSRR